MRFTVIKRFPNNLKRKKEKLKRRFNKKNKNKRNGKKKLKQVK